MNKWRPIEELLNIVACGENNIDVGVPLKHVPVSTGYHTLMVASLFQVLTGWYLVTYINNSHLPAKISRQTACGHWAQGVLQISSFLTSNIQASCSLRV
jgi:hypothetical protein